MPLYRKELRLATTDSDHESPQDHNGEARGQQRRARSMKVESVSQPPQIFSGTTQLPRWLAAITMGHRLRRVTRHSDVVRPEAFRKAFRTAEAGSYFL